MSQEPFDKAIKESLENLEIAFNADHWQQMEMLLHNLPVGDEGAIDAHFDSMITDKIANPTISLNHSAWAGIEAGLVKAEVSDTAFDGAITEKLNTPLNIVAPNWDQIANALDKADAADDAFDAEIYTSLQNLQASPPTNYWQRLLKRLNADVALREKLYRYKLIEATLMILLLLNFYQYLPIHQFFIPATIQQQELNQANTPAPIASTKKEIDSQEVATTTITPKTQTASNTPIKPLIPKQVIQTKDKDNQKTTLINQDIVDPTENVSPRIVRNYSLTNPIAILPTTMSQRSGLSISVSEMNQHLTLYTETGNSLIGTIPSLRPNFIESQYITPLGCKDCRYTKVPARLRLGLVANLASTNVALVLNTVDGK